MTPVEVGHLAPVEILEMLDGIDWVNDREWEKALFVRMPDPATALDILEYHYPHFRTDRVVTITRGESSRRQRKRGFSDG